MPRVARIVVPGVAHHVTQRGNNRQQVFFSDDDRALYLALLKAEAERFDLEILGYCLMSNHMHLVAIPAGAETLAKAVGRTDYRYTQAVNRSRGWSGHLWQNRFYSCPLDEVHQWQALAYVDLNPVRAKLVRQARRYRWSSAAAHCGQADPAELVNPRAWRKHWRRGDWSAVLAEGHRDEELEALRRQTHTGRPWGGEAFLARIESRIAREVRPRPVGRPRKPPASEARMKKRVHASGK
jgi:putative transposase